jgi:hypothetical protein
LTSRGMGGVYRPGTFFGVTRPRFSI